MVKIYLSESVLDPCLAKGVEVPLDLGEAVEPAAAPGEVAGAPVSLRMTIWVWRTKTPCLSAQAK